LLRVWRETGSSVVFVTHDLDEAVHLADRVLLGGHPARVVREIEVTAPRPRQRGTAEQGEQVGALRQALGQTFISGGGI